MDATEQATDQLARVMFMGSEYALRLSGTGATKFLSYLTKTAKGTGKTKGEIRLESLLKSGRPLSVFEIKQADLKAFEKEAKRYGILYTVIAEKNAPKDTMVDIMVKTDDAGRMNRIFEKLKLGTVDKATVEAVVEDIKEKRQAKEPEAAVKDTQKSARAEQVIDDMLTKNAEKEREPENPTAAKMGKSPQSEHSSDKGRPSDEVTEKGKGDPGPSQAPKGRSSRDEERARGSKPSVREEMSEIRQERKATSRFHKTPEQNQHRQPAARRGKQLPKEGR